MSVVRRLACLVLGMALLAPAGPALAAPEPEPEPFPLGVDPGAAIEGLDWPNRRFAPCSAYDAEAGRWIVFGGRATDEVTHYRDTWSLESRPGRQARWRLLAGADTPGAPPPLRSCSAVHDPEGDRLLVFGGWDGVTQHGDVWALALDGAPEWSRLCADGGCGDGPSPRRAAQAVLDGPRQRLLVFAGTDGTYRNDLWALPLTGDRTWRNVTSEDSPPARAGHALALDAGREQAWVFGGSAPGTERNDVWRLDLPSLSWTRVLADGCAQPCPAGRGGATLVHDQANDALVLFGGYDAARGVYPDEVAVLEGLEGATPAWRRAEPASAGLQPRAYHAAAYDPRQQRMLVFGGAFGSGALKDVGALLLPADRSPVWRGVPPATPLTPRDQASLHYDPGTSSLYAFGGFGAGGFPDGNQGGTHLADTFRLPLSRPSPTWRNATPRTPAVPLQREAGAFASDQAGRRLLVFGGLHGDRSLNDVWVADVSASSRPAWRQLCSPRSCGPAPEPRWGGHAVYDPARDRLVVFGGRGTGGVSYADAWELSLGARPRWSRLTPAGASPPPRWGGAVAYDAARRRMVVWGGQAGIDAEAVSHADTWALALDGEPAWTALAPEGRAPSARRSMAYAAASGDGAAQLLVFGGYTPAGAIHHNDVARLALDAEQGRWERLSPDDCASPAAPSCRRSAGAVHDPAGERLVVAFGRDATALFADTHAFDLATATWSVLADPDAPSPEPAAAPAAEATGDLPGAAETSSVTP